MAILRPKDASVSPPTVVIYVEKARDLEFVAIPTVV
jgi:hypothetical protein